MLCHLACYKIQFCFLILFYISLFQVHSQYRIASSWQSGTLMPLKSESVEWNARHMLGALLFALRKIIAFTNYLFWCSSPELS